MSEIKRNYIDVWSNIKITLRKHKPIDAFILIASRGYGHSIRQIGKILDMAPMDVRKTIAKLERAIRKDLKAQGANLKKITHMSDSDFILEMEAEEISPDDN